MNKRRIAALAAVGALVLAGCGSQAATSSTSGAGGTAQQSRPGGPDFGSLATALGVSTTKLQAAMAKLRPAQGQAPQAGSADDMAAKLAQELGLTTAKVKAALAKYMPQGGPPAGGGNGPAPPSGTQS